jgi:hypothetical protein
MALSILVACIVQALDAPKGGVRQAFEKNLSSAYKTVRDFEYDTTAILETLAWTTGALRELDKQQS